MNYLCEGRVGADRNLDWLKRFDVVVTGCAKPKFFTKDSDGIFRVDPETGKLSNTDSGAPLSPVDFPSTSSQARTSGAPNPRFGDSKV